MYQIQRTINQNDCTHFSIASACFVARLGKGRYILHIGIYPVTWNVPNSTNNKPE